MKVLFLLFLFITIDRFTNARRRMFKKRDAFNCADTVSRIASDIAAKASVDAKNVHCAPYDCCCDKICSVKQKLADKADEAAQITQSNLASKLALVNQLADEKQAVTLLLQELMLSKKQLEDAIDKEIVALATVTTLQEVLDKALQLASRVAANSDIVCNSVSRNIQIVDRILKLQNDQCHILCQKEYFARRDLEATRLAEKEAVAAATIAKNDALEIEKQQNTEYF